jgi:hypothetical protein
LVPGLERLQEQLFAVQQDTAALLEGQKEETAAIKEIKELLAAVRGGGGSEEQALLEIRRVLRPNVPNIDEIKDNRLADVVQGILDASQKPAARPENLSGTVIRVLTVAQAQAAELKFADAAQGLDAALARTDAKDKNRARGHAALLAERGRIASLQLRHRDAATFYAKAAEAAAFAPTMAWNYTMDSAGALDHRYQDRASLAPLVCRRAGNRREGHP